MILTVAMGEGAVAAASDILEASSCGSCVILVLYDAKVKVGGLAHIMLPASGVRDCGPAFDGDEAYQYADTAVPRLIEEMRRMGGSRKDIVAKMAGGAAMFPSYSTASAGIGRQNVDGVKDVLGREVAVDRKRTSGNESSVCVDLWKNYPGIYFVEVSTGNVIFIKKVVLSH